MTDDIQNTTERTHMLYTESLETSACLSEISGALVALQLAQCSATPDKINPRFKSKYTSLESLQTAVLPTLAEHGVALIQNPTLETTPEGSIVVVQTLLTHPSGEYLLARSASAPLDRTDIQAVGSTITYLRRYSAAGILSIIQALPTEDDDDGNAATPETPSQQSTRTPSLNPKMPAIITGYDEKRQQCVVKQGKQLLTLKVSHPDLKLHLEPGPTPVWLKWNKKEGVTAVKPVQPGTDDIQW